MPRYGDEVVIRRGGHVSPRIGRYRDVRARYVGSRGFDVRCQLLEDDPDALVSPLRKGEYGWWSRSVMKGKV